MQTPGRQVAPQTPMIPMERRMDLAYDRLLQRATEATQNLEQPQTRVLGRVISQLESMNNTMRSIQDQIREDVRAKRRYYREEARLLRKDNQNLSDVKTSVLSGLRKSLGGAAALTGAAQLGAGNIGGGLQSLGLAGALMSPEIVEFLTGSVVNVLALKGLIGGGKGAAVSGVGRNVAGASKLKNPLLITAALAASLLIPSLANAGQGGDRRRQDLVRKELEGEQTINKPDVNRFRSLLDRFDSILSGITLDKEKEKGQVDPDKLEGVKVNQIEVKQKEVQDINDADIAALNTVLPNKSLVPKNEDKKTDKDLTAFVTTNIGETIFNEEVNEGDVNVDATSKNNVNVEGDQILITQNQNIEGAEEITELITPPDNIEENNKQLNEKLDIANLSKEIKPRSEVSNNLYNIDMTQDDSPKTISGFTGLTATPDSVFVSTKFSSGGGLFDRFEAASSLRTYGAYS
tara:strand:- start:2821 stop:4206 length:1386 start_codon:yes stop_codon:yes gene_type:complete